VTKFIYFVEGLSVWTGRAFGWCILILTLSVTYEVFVRYALNSPTVWAFDMMVQMYGALFLMAGAYALAQDGHVRADVLYRLFPVRVQASLDFLLYLVFFFPGVLALFWYGAEIASDSWRYKEVSCDTTGGRLTTAAGFVRTFPLRKSDTSWLLDGAHSGRA